jgi:dTDP-4-amino-4,6-dideoxygalactose transaminase
VMNIPFLDLRAQYASIHKEITAALRQVLDSAAFAGGPFVEKFEREFASFCRCQFAIGVGSGTAALWMALLALGIRRGDEVITVPNTFIATCEAITFCGAKPVLVDIDEQTYTMNPDHIERVITPRTKAVLPVHLFGQMADMDPIMEIARAHRLFVIEDACQAHGAEYKGRRAGSIGDMGCFSFYPAKNLGAYGEAGAVVTNRGDLADKIRMFRDHGQAKKYYHRLIGWNGRMDGFQGAVLSVKLKYLAAWNEARRKNAQLYSDLLAGVDNVITPAEADYAKHVYHIYGIRTPNRDDLMSALAKKGIGCGIHYPVPVHLQRAYESLGHEKGSFPIAEKCAEQLVSLPMFPELSQAQIEKVYGEIQSFLRVKV